VVQDRLRALLAPGHDSFKRHNAALALAVVGDQSPEIVAYAQDAVAKQLPDPHTSAPPTTPGNAGDAAVLAACLPMERRVELARYYCERILDTTAAENTRVTYANACRLAAKDLAAEIRQELYDQLIPLRTPPESTHPSDLLAHRLRDPFSFIRIDTTTGALRREIVKTLAVLAAHHDRQDFLWKAAQPLAVSGASADVRAVGDVGFTLARNGYAPHLPWASLAFSSDSETRKFAAALIPFIPDLDAEAITTLARDDQTPVRCELAQSITNIRSRAGADVDHSLIVQAAEILRTDTSYRVREILARSSAPDPTDRTGSYHRRGDAANLRRGCG
jgi:hypothetical protein